MSASQQRKHVDIEAELLLAAYARKLLNVHMSVGTAVIGGALLYEFVFPERAFLWCIVFLLVVMVFGYIECAAFARRAAGPLNVAFWSRVLFWQSTASGLSWASAPAVLILLSQEGAHAVMADLVHDHSHLDGPQLALLVGMLFGVGAIAMSSIAAQPKSLAGLLGAMFIPPALALGLSGELTLALVGGVLIAGMGFMIFVAFQSHAAMRQLLQTESDLRLMVSEANRAREQAVAAGEVKSQFLANMSHEIRTPMNGVLGMLQLLRRTELSGKQLDYASKGEAAASALLRLLDDFLDFAKIGAGKMSIHLQPLHLRELLGELVQILEATVGAKPVQLKLHIAPNVPHTVLGDALRLQQVLVNLGGNAVKFTPSGEVRIEIDCLSRSETLASLKFSVHDSGIGIAPDDQMRIFDGFSQAEASTTRRFGGTGLGLSISKQVVELMGGEISLASQLGQGSVFSFTLDFDLDPSLDSTFQSASTGIVDVPVQTVEPPPVGGTTASTARPKRLMGMRILLVEDNAINQQIARELLRSEGAVVTLADDGQQGVDAIADNPGGFDAVLMDLQMPVLDGFAATQAIRQLESQRATTRTPIVAMTANTSNKDRQDCLDAGMDDHVGKPFNLTKLVGALVAASQRRK